MSPVTSVIFVYAGDKCDTPSSGDPQGKSPYIGIPINSGDAIFVSNTTIHTEILYWRYRVDDLNEFIAGVNRKGPTKFKFARCP